MKQFRTKTFDEVFPIIDISKLIGHKFLKKYRPKGIQQKKLRADIRKGIKLKLPAFRVPCMDPSEENGKIVFKPGKEPALGHSSWWWDEKWKEFNPEKNSRIGNRLERAAFLGTIIKLLIDEKNYSVAAAWKAVCDDSRDLGHYCNSKDSSKDYEPTGSRKVGAFFDLANTFKIIRESKGSGFLRTSGRFDYTGDGAPLADLQPIHCFNFSCGDSVAWGVMDV